MARTYGRILNPDGTYQWVKVETDAKGFDDYVYITTLIQCLKLSINESPFFANYGIPAQRTVIQQVFPDYYVYQTQSQFSKYFASLIISKRPVATPTYDVKIITNQGKSLEMAVAV